MAKRKETTDLSIENHGSIYLLRPVSAAGREWIGEHIPADAMVWAGAVVVEHRYISDIAEGAVADGLVVR